MMPASIIEINLLKNLGPGSKPLGKFLRWSLSYGRYIIIGTQIVVLLAFFSRFKLDQELSDLHAKIEEKSHIIKTLEPVEIATRDVQQKLVIIEKLETNRNYYLSITNQFAKEVPEDVYITQLKFNNDDFIISGKSYSNFGFNDLLTYLRKSGFFNQITLDDVNKDSIDQSINFKISMKTQEQIK